MSKEGLPKVAWSKVLSLNVQPHRRERHQDPRIRFYKLTQIPKDEHSKIDHNYRLKREREE